MIITSFLLIIEIMLMGDLLIILKIMKIIVDYYTEINFIYLTLSSLSKDGVTSFQKFSCPR